MLITHNTGHKFMQFYIGSEPCLPINWTIIHFQLFFHDFHEERVEFDGVGCDGSAFFKDFGEL